MQYTAKSYNTLNKAFALASSATIKPNNGMIGNKNALIARYHSLVNAVTKGISKTAVKCIV